MVDETHFSYFADVVRRAEPEITGPDQVAARHLESENDNFRRERGLGDGRNSSLW